MHTMHKLIFLGTLRYCLAASAIVVLIVVAMSPTLKVFAANYTLTVTVTPPGSGTVTLTPPGGSYAPDKNVFFKATPSTGYYFVGWGLSSPTASPSPGDGNMYYYTYLNPANKSLDGNLRLLAYFQPQNQWIRYSSNPVLVGGGAWDPNFVYGPRVFTYPNGTYGTVFLGGCVTGNPSNACTRAVGLATSPDGLHWTQYPSPVLSPGTGMDWDSYSGGGRNAIALGSVFWDGTQYRLYYSASLAFGFATSSDTIHWTKYSGNPVLSNLTEYAQGGRCAYYSQQFRYPDVLMVGGTYMMYYMRGGGIRVATSADGVSWSVQNGGCAVVYPADWDDSGTWPNLPHAYSWDGDWTSYASVKYDPLAKNFKMFYSACDVDCAIERTGFAVSPNGIGFSWTKYVGNPAISPLPGVFDNGDTTVAADFLPVNGTLMVYYEADTANSQMCRNGYDLNCNNLIETSIGSTSINEVPLNKGWNLVSLPVVPNNNALKAILAPQLAAGEVTIVWSYTGTPRTWQKFIPPSTGTLTTMVDGNGYWILMTAPDTLLVGGTVIPPGASPSTYTLLAGWNLVGFKPQPALADETVSQFLISLSSYDANHVWVWDNYAGGWIKADPSTWLVPGQALWVYVTSPTGATLRP